MQSLSKSIITIILFLSSSGLLLNPSLKDGIQPHNPTHSATPYFDGPEGFHWELDSSIPGDVFTDCDFLSENDGWAVGYSGDVIHWDGERWNKAASPLEGSFHRLNTVDMVTSDDVWIAGDYGTIYEWNGSVWVDSSINSDIDIYDLSFASSSFGVAVGGTSSLYGDEQMDRWISHWNGSIWQEVPFPEFIQDTDPRLRSVLMISDKFGWISGYQQFFHWNNVQWEAEDFNSALDTPMTQINDFSVLSDDSIWGVGSRSYQGYHGGGIIHWDGKEWNEVYQSEYYLTSIVMLSEERGWALGASQINWRPENAYDNMIFLWDGDTWSEFMGINNSQLSSICGMTENNLWILGEKKFRLVEDSTPTPIPTHSLTTMPQNEITITVDSPLDSTVVTNSSTNNSKTATTPFIAETNDGSKQYLLYLSIGIISLLTLFFLFPVINKLFSSKK